MTVDVRYDDAPLSTSTTDNWVARRGGLPPYVRAVTRGIMKSGPHTESEAIQIAIGRLKDWAAGGGQVTAKTRAKAAAAIAQWEAMKASAGRSAVTEASSFGSLLPVEQPNPTPHLYVPSGTAGKCRVCGRAPSDLMHAAALSRLRHAGPGHAPVKGGHVKTVEQHVLATARTVDRHATSVEGQAHDQMVRLFDRQRDTVLSRLKGRRGLSMVRDAQEQFRAFNINEPRDLDGKWGNLDNDAKSIAKSAAELSDSVESRYPGVQLTLSENPARVTINKIVVPKESRSSGIGTKIMQEITAYADAHGKRLDLTPSSDFGGTKSRLITFYKRFGFIENKGRNKNYEVSEDMYRLPVKERSFRAAIPAPQPDDEQPEQPAPVIEPSAVFDTAYWTQQTANALQDVYGTAQALTVGRLGDSLHPDLPTPAAAVQTVEQILALRAATVGAQITETTYQQIAAQLTQGLAAGEHIDELAKRVGTVFADATDSRARTIARTESIGAINQAADSYASALPGGMVAYKRWLAVEDSRTRPAHADADGQQQNVGDPFVVGGFPLQHPGDPTAPPSDVINCRCTAVYMPRRLTPVS